MVQMVSISKGFKIHNVLKDPYELYACFLGDIPQIVSPLSFLMNWAEARKVIHKGSMKPRKK